MRISLGPTISGFVPDVFRGFTRKYKSSARISSSLTQAGFLMRKTIQHSSPSACNLMVAQPRRIQVRVAPPIRGIRNHHPMAAKPASVAWA